MTDSDHSTLPYRQSQVLDPIPLPQPQPSADGHIEYTVIEVNKTTLKESKHQDEFDAVLLQTLLNGLYEIIFLDRQYALAVSCSAAARQEPRNPLAASQFKLPLCGRVILLPASLAQKKRPLWHFP